MENKNTNKKTSKKRTYTKKLKLNAVIDAIGQIMKDECYDYDNNCFILPLHDKKYKVEITRDWKYIVHTDRDICNDWENNFRLQAYIGSFHISMLSKIGLRIFQPEIEFKNIS